MKLIKTRKISIGGLLLAAFSLRLILVLISNYHPDILNHVDWGNRFWQYGPKRFYEASVWSVSWPNQPSGSIYLFAAITKIYQWLFAALWQLNIRFSAFPSFIFPFLEAKLHIILLKIPFILADLGIGWLIYKMALKGKVGSKRANFAASLFLFNPALIYNSAIWGQTDSLINFLALLALWLIYKRNYFGGIFSFILSLYLKLSLIIWAPVFFLVIILRRDFKKAVFPALFSFLLIVIASLPFSGDRNPVSWIWYLYSNRVLARQGDMLSGNAFNLWTLLRGVDFSLKENILTFGVPAKAIGRVLASGSMIAIGFLFVLKDKKKQATRINNMLWAVTLISFSTFLFLTNMHERYLYPIFAPMAILVAMDKLKLKWYLALSLVSWLNLYNLWWYPNIPFLRRALQFRQFLLPRLLSLLIMVIFGVLFWQWKNSRGEKTAKIKNKDWQPVVQLRK